MALDRYLSLDDSRAVFSLFWGCWRPSFANAIADHLDTIRWSDLAFTHGV
jgi:hypothetical protein